MSEDKAIAAIKLALEQYDYGCFRAELQAVARRLGITEQVATKLETILHWRMSPGDHWRTRGCEPPRTLAELLARDTRRHNISRTSKSWQVLRAWLVDMGVTDLAAGDPLRPRCSHCGAILRGG